MPVFLAHVRKQTKSKKQQLESGSETFLVSFSVALQGAKSWTVTDQPDSIGGPLCSVYEALFALGYSSFILKTPST